MRGRLYLAAMMLCAPCAFADDWPQFRGLDGTGISSESGVVSTLTIKELWRAKMTDKGYASAAVAGGKLYIIDHNGAEDLVRCFNLTSGAELWRYGYPDAKDANYGFARATPCISDGLVYTVSRNGKLLCLTADKGKLIWSRSYDEFKGQTPGWGHSASPIIDGERLLVVPGGDNAAMAVLDKKNGKTVWASGNERASYATPVIATINGQKQYLVFSATALVSYDAAAGKQLWRFPWKTSYDVNAAQPIVIDNSVFISSGYNTGCALLDITPAGPRQRWRNKAMQQHFSSAILWNGMLYGTTDPGRLVCLDPADGSEKWHHDGFEKGGCVAIGSTLIALCGKTGELVMVDLNPTEYKETGRMTILTGQSWTAPIIADGKLIIRNTESLVCLKLR